MRDFYFDGHNGVELLAFPESVDAGGTRTAWELSYDGRPLYRITFVHVVEEERRCGVGNKLMRTVLDEADREGAWLLLTVEPDEDEDAEWLGDWFVRLGFEPVDPPEQRLGATMLRQPRNQDGA